MIEHRLLKNPPITEAVIDLRVKSRREFDRGDLDTVAQRLADEYPDRDELRTREFLLEIGPNDEPVAAQRGGTVGLRLRALNGRRVVQLRSNGFTYSWLKPYSSWEDLRSAARRVWNTYSEVVMPESVTRTAVRYINHIPLTLPIQELRDLLPVSPDLPAAWPQWMTGYLSRIGVTDEETSDQAIVTQTYEQGADPHTITFLVDIDCFNRNPVRESDDIWDLLDRLRILKNQIFFSSVTERLLEMFE